jgi:2-polyprenyl-6-methoxyphenol hydroxylase-like FAD-dependent oxidoreductase
MDSYDIIIVGGRPAGASLAMRLGARGLNVLVVDKAEFPSDPEVPASPLIYPRTIAMIEELGVDAASYGPVTVPVRNFVMQFEGSFRAHMQIVAVDGIDVVLGVDRVGFDHLLWTRLEQLASVTTRAGFKVEGIERDRDGRVVGISGRERDGALEHIRARVCVVGADGRHSVVARRVGARVLEQAPHTSTVYQALWEDIADCPGEAGHTVTHLVTRGRGQSILFFPAPYGRNWLIVHTRSDRVHIDGDAQGFYRAALESYPSVHARMRDAKQVSGVRGVKRVANAYLEAGGPGWLLVGDAVHKKDPIDGQGIYDALAETRRLAEILVRHAAGELDWPSVVSSWERALHDETEAMFRSTLARLKNELYGEPPQAIINSVLRWLMTDPQYQRQFMLYLSRAIPVEGWPPPSLLAGACARGLWGDIKRRFGGERRTD